MSGDSGERVILERIREGYEADGYQFIIAPAPKLTPPSLSRYRFDAMALKGHEKVLIEVKRSRSSTSDQSLAELADAVERLGGGWRLSIVYLNETESTEVSARPVDPNALWAATREVKSLSASGHYAAALVIGWGVVEALARKTVVDGDGVQIRGLSPARAVDLLEQSGELAYENAATLRGLTSLRNAVVHGDFTRTVEPGAVRALIDCIEPLVGPPVPEAAE